MKHHCLSWPFVKQKHDAWKYESLYQCPKHQREIPLPAHQKQKGRKLRRTMATYSHCYLKMDIIQILHILQFIESLMGKASNFVKIVCGFGCTNTKYIIIITIIGVFSVEVSKILLQRAVNHNNRMNTQNQPQPAPVIENDEGITEVASVVP